MENKILLLRISYWIPALCDYLLAVLVMIPELNGAAGYSITMGMMSSAAFSWGTMLIFADRKPVERRWVLLPTMLIVLLLGTVTAIAGFSGTVSAARTILRVTLYAAVLILVSYSYFTTKQLKE